MITVKKIIYWHFAVYKGDAVNIDPDDLPLDAISSLDTTQLVPKPILVNANPRIRAFSLTTGFEWLVDIYVSEGVTKDLDEAGNSTTIRANNPTASPGFAWFDLNVAQLTALFGAPILVDNLAQLAPDATPEGGRARQKIQYVIFGAHKDGDTSPTSRAEPDEWFAFNAIPSEVSAAGDTSHLELKAAMTPKTFVDDEGGESGFFIKVKSHEEVDKLGCCDILSSSSSSSSSDGGSSSSSSDSEAGGTPCPDGGTINTVRGYPRPDSRKRIWAVRQTVDIHASNYPVSSGGYFSTENILTRRKLFSELIYVDVEDAVASSSFEWNKLAWNHAGYISFRDQQPELAHSHILPEFNKTSVSVGSGAITAHAPYDYDYELPITIQALTWDDRGYLWALCSGGATDATQNNFPDVGNVKTTEGIYRLIPGGWQSKAVDFMCWGGTNTGKLEESDFFNGGFIASIVPGSMSWGLDRSGNYEFLAAIDTQSNLRIWQEKSQGTKFFPDDSTIVNDSGKILTAHYIDSGIDKICVIDLDKKPYLISQDVVSDAGLLAFVNTERSNGERYSLMISGREFVIGITVGGRLKVFANPSLQNVMPTQEMADELSDKISAGGDRIKEITCGDAFFAVLTESLDPYATNSGKVHARGYMNGKIIYNNGEYTADVVNTLLFETNDAAASITAFGDFLIGVEKGEPINEGENPVFPGYFRFATVLHSYRLNDDATAIKAPEWSSLNKIKRILISATSGDLTKPEFFTQPVLFTIKLPKSKGLIGAYWETAQESSEYIYSPYYGQSSDVIDDLQAYPGVFGHAVATSPAVETYAQGDYVVISAPGEGGAFGGSWINNAPGAVYIFKRTAHELTFIQKITNITANAKNHGAHLAMFKTKDADENTVLGLACSYRDINNGTHKIRIYHLDSSGNYFNFYSDGIPAASNEGAQPCDILSMYANDGILVIAKNVGVPTQIFTCIDTNNDLDDIGNAPGAHIEIDYGSLPVNVGTRAGVSVLREQSGFTMIVSDIAMDDTPEQVVFGSDGSDSGHIKINYNNKTENGHGGFFVFHMRVNPGDGISFTSGSGTAPAYFKQTENFNNPLGGQKSNFGYSIVCDENNICVSAVYDSTYGYPQAGSVFTYEWFLNDDSPLRSINQSTSKKITLRDLDDWSTGNIHLNDKAYEHLKFGASMLLKNGSLIIGAWENDDFTLGCAEINDQKPGSLSLWRKNNIGVWGIVATSQSGSLNSSKGDRFGCSLAVIDVSGGGFVLLSGASGLITGANEEQTVVNAEGDDVSAGGAATKGINPSVAGIVKTILISGSGAFGSLPSRTPKRYENSTYDNTGPYNFTFLNNAFGKRHVSVGITQNTSAYTTVYSPARLIERSVIETDLDPTAIPKFKLAKFAKDPMTGRPMPSTYSDLGAFSMESDLNNDDNQTASDITVAALPLYDSQSYTIRVLEMHPRPYRTIDVSSAINSTNALSDAKINVPLQISEGVLDWATLAISNGSEIYLYAPIVEPSPTPTPFHIGDISLSRSFAISPLRADRWLVPVSEISPENFDLYNFGLAINTNFASFTYNFEGGYYTANTIALTPTVSTHTSLIGNPIIKAKDIEPATEKWWTAGNYYSPGCVQLIQSGRVGGIALKKGIVGSPSSFNLKYNNAFVYKTYNPVSPQNVVFNINLGRSVKVHDIWGLKIAEGSWGAAFLEDFPILPIQSVSATSQFLGWSACSLDVGSNYLHSGNSSTNHRPIGTSFDAKYKKCAPSADSVDFDLGHQFSLPTVHISATKWCNKFDSATDVTNDALGFGKNIMYQGVKDPVIHGKYNYNKFNAVTDPNLSSITADRRSMIITFHSGFGATVRPFKNDDSSFAYFAPQLKFTALLDRRFSSWKNFFNCKVVGIIGLNNFITVSADPSWVSQKSTGSANVDETLSYSSCVAPTDTLYVTDIFHDSSTRSDVPSPTGIRNIIYNYCFPSNDFNFYKELASRPNDAYQCQSTTVCNAHGGGGLEYISAVDVGTTAQVLPIVYSLKNPDETIFTSISDSIFGARRSMFAEQITSGESYRVGSASFQDNLTVALKATNYLGKISTGELPFYPGVLANSGINPGDMNIFDYPTAANMLYGRGRNVQISPSGLECRSTGRDEIIFQNEFIYRKLSYHNSSTNYPHGVPKFTDRRLAGSFDDLIRIAPVKIYTNINNDLESPFEKDNIIIRQRADVGADQTFTLTSPDYTFNFDHAAYEHYEIYDRVAPTDLFTENSLVCMPTFSLPDMFNITQSGNNAFGHVFGVGNGFTINPDNPYIDGSNVSSLIYYGINFTNVSPAVRLHVGLGDSIFNNSAFVKAVQNKYAHIIDVNSSVVSIDNSSYMLTVSILASLNADGNPSPTNISDSWRWQNTFDPSIYGGGLICAIMTAMLDGNKKIINNSWRSTFSTNTSINGVTRDAGITANISPQFLCANQWNRNGIWMQPLIGLARSGDNYNSPWYWPGNYPWSNSNNATSLGPKPKDIVTSRPNFFHTPPGMIKVPMDRSFIHKMGKHSIVKHSNAGVSKWFAVIGPVVYQVNSASDLQAGPWAWIKSSSMSCVPTSGYVWDSRPVIFQRFGFTKFELLQIVNLGNKDILFSFAECASNPTPFRLVKSHYSDTAFRRDLDAIPAIATQVKNELINFDAFNQGNQGNQGSYAMLGEGVGFSKQDGSVLRSFVWWKDGFYHITPGPSAPLITKINLPASIVTQVKSAYSLHRLSGYFNGNDRFVISGNASNNEPFMHVFRFKSDGVQTLDGFDGVGFALEYSFPVTQPTPTNELFTASEFDPMCNQSWRYSTWMSSDASIIAVGNHQWDVDTSSGNPSAFNVQIYLRTSINNQLKYVLLSNNTLTVDDNVIDRPVESFCQSIWGVQEGGFWSIYVCSGADPNADDRDYLDTGNILPEKRFGRVHVFKAQATGPGGKNVIELNDMAIATDPEFKDSAFANMNFWTMTPVSAKNGMCGIMFYPSTGMVVSTAGNLAKMRKGSGDNNWKLDKFAGQASGALGTTKTIAVRRVIAPYNYFGYIDTNTTENITYADISKDIFKLSTVAVPSCNSTASDSGMQRYASKLSFVRLNVDNVDFDSIISISNSNSITSNQFGVFDTETDLSSGECNPAYYYLQGKRSSESSGAEKQIFNPSFRAWLCSFDILNSSFGTVKDLPYQSYNSDKENDAHIIVKPPVPDAANRQMYFAGLDCAPVDGNPLYRDYNDNLEDVKGTLMQMDWHDIAGVLWWGGNNIYVLRSHNHQNNSIADGNTIDDIQEHVNKKSYSVTEDGAVLVGQNAVSVFKMPTTGTLVTRPTKVTTERIGIKGIGLSGPMAITVAACSNPSHVKDNPKAEFTYITPLMRRRDILGPQRVGIVVDDSDAMNESYLNADAISSFKKVSIISDSFASPSISTTTSIPTMTGKRGEQAMCDFSWKLAFKKDGYAYNDFVLNGQPGVSIPDMVHSNGDGAQIFSRKYKLSSSHTKWNKIIEDISASLDHKVGNVYNGDKIFVIRKSFVYKNFGQNSAHLDPSWYYVPSTTGDVIFTHKVGLLPCNCKDKLYAASRYISKWKTNSSATGNILDMLVKNSGQNECRLISSVDVSASQSEKLKDLVLIGMITDTIISNAESAVSASAPSTVGLLNHIYNNLYNGDTSLMAQNGMVHIIDTNKGISSEKKLGFIRLFQSKFNGTYTTIKGY